MELNSSSSLNSYGDSCIEEILERFDPYIIAHVKKLALHNISWVHPDLLSLELDEIIQLVRIKFWRALRKQEIQYPSAYIQRIISNELVDIGRRRKPELPLEEDNGDAIQLVEALKTHQVEVDVAQWPDNQEDEQRLKASITFARQKIAKRWHVNISDCTRRGVGDTPLSCIENLGT